MLCFTQDFLSIFTRSEMTASYSGDVSTADSGDQTSNCTQPIAPMTPTSSASERDCAVLPRPDRPTTLSRPIRLPTCCDFRRQPWRNYVHGEFSYSSAAAAPRSYTGVDDELGAAADNDAVVRIIESLQSADGRSRCGNGCHDNAVNNPDVGNSGRDESRRENGFGNGEASSDRTECDDRTAQNARKSSREIAAVRITTAGLSSDAKCTHRGNGLTAVDGVAVKYADRKDGGEDVVHVVRSEHSPTPGMRQDVNQNLRPIDGAKRSADVAPETKIRCQTETETGNCQQPAESTAGPRQKCKWRRGRNRSLTSRDQRPTNGGAERQNQHGGRKSARSRTLSPALTKQRFDYHVPRRPEPQADPSGPETGRRDVTSASGSDVCFQPGVHRNSRNSAAAKSACGQSVNGPVSHSSPASSRRFTCQPHANANARL